MPRGFASGSPHGPLRNTTPARRHAAPARQLVLAPGVLTQEFDVWLATELTSGPTAQEASEAGMTCASVPECELRARIRDGRIPDNPSVAAYGLPLLDREEVRTRCRPRSRVVPGHVSSPVTRSRISGGSSSTSSCGSTGRSSRESLTRLRAAAREP